MTIRSNANNAIIDARELTHALTNPMTYFPFSNLEGSAMEAIDKLGAIFQKISNDSRPNTTPPPLRPISVTPRPFTAAPVRIIVSTQLSLRVLSLIKNDGGYIPSTPISSPHDPTNIPHVIPIDTLSIPRVNIHARKVKYNLRSQCP